MYKKVKVVKMPKGEDVNVIGRKKTMSLVKSTKFVTHRELIAMNLELEVEWEE